MAVHVTGGGDEIYSSAVFRYEELAGPISPAYSFTHSSLEINWVLCELHFVYRERIQKSELFMIYKIDIPGPPAIMGLHCWSCWTKHSLFQQQKIGVGILPSTSAHILGWSSLWFMRGSVARDCAPFYQYFESKI